MASKKVTLEALDKKFDERFTKLEDLIESGNASNAKHFAAITEDIEDVRTELKGDIGNLGEQLTNMEAELKPVTRANLPPRTSDLEKEIFGTSKAPRLEHGL